MDLLLFGSRKVDWVDGVVRLDNWINLDMDPSIASMIVALRPALESLVIRASKEPEQILEMGNTDLKVGEKKIFLSTISCVNLCCNWLNKYLFKAIIQMRSITDIKTKLNNCNSLFIQKVIYSL